MHTLALIVVSVLMAVLPVGLAQESARYTRADLEEGAGYFMNACADCHGPDGDVIPGAELNRPSLRRATTNADLERIILNGIPGTGMPPAALNLRQLDTIIGYVRSLASAAPAEAGAGNAANGRAIFETAGCLDCHRVNGTGSRSGPDLSRIGLLRRAASLRQSVIDPGAEIRPENRYMDIITEDGEAIRGRLLNQDTDTIQLAGPDGRPRSFVKSRLRSVTPDPISPMPAFRDRLSEGERADLLAYLISLRGLE